jgi:hypothetical protein
MPADVHANAGELLRISELRCTNESFRELKSQLQQPRRARLRQTQINDFGCYSTLLLDIHHDVAWFYVPVNKFMFVDGSQTGGHLRRDFQR